MGGGRGGGSSGRGGGGGGCEWRSEAFVKIQKKKYFLLGGGWGRVGSGVRGIGFGGQGGCERISEVFVKTPKNILFFLFFIFFLGGGSGLGGVRVDVKGEVKFL